MISEETQKIGRPRQLYTGPTERLVPDMRARVPSVDSSLLGSTRDVSFYLGASSPSAKWDEGIGFREKGGEYEIVDENSGEKSPKPPHKARFHRPN